MFGLSRRKLLASIAALPFISRLEALAQREVNEAIAYFGHLVPTPIYFSHMRPIRGNHFALIEEGRLLDPHCTISVILEESTMLTVVKPDIDAKVFAAVKKFANPVSAEITNNLPLEGLGYDSLSRVELAMEIEDVLGLEFNDLELSEAYDVGDVLRIVRERAG